MVLMQISLIKRKMRPVLLSHGVRRAGLFGSAARKQMHKGSDIDILIEIRKGASLLDIIALKLHAENVLRRKVDLVEYSAIRAPLRKHILSEEVSLL